MIKKQKVFFVHGGETFETYEKYINWLKNKNFSWEIEREKKKKWSNHLNSDLGDNFEYMPINMPNKYNSKYNEWKIWFEKVLNTFNFNEDEKICYVGHSLGGTFLLKYFSENLDKIKNSALFLVSSAVLNNSDKYNLDTFELNFDLIQKIDNENIFLYHSKDDFIVDYSDFLFLEKLLPHANKTIFEDRQHINMEKFPEIVRDIKSFK